MRLIDADELGYTLTDGLKCAMCVNPMHTDRGCDGNCMIPNQLLLNALEKYIADGINNQKTIDSVPVRRGKWRNYSILSSRKICEVGDLIERQCSACNRFSISFRGSSGPEYCCHCGAMMGGDSE